MGREDRSRLLELESEVRRLSRRVERLEGDPTPRTPGPTAVVPMPRKASSAEKPCRRNVEELVGGRLLALTGGIAVLLGVTFFVALAVDRGWIGEGARIAVAFGGSLALLAAGAWLYEARGRTQAALAAVGTAVGALYLTLSAATSLYELVPVALALPLAFTVGAVATALAVRWDSRTVAGLGILGALASPALLGQVTDSSGVAFLAVALAAAAGVLLWRRWEWLRIAAFAVAMPQVAVWALETSLPRAVLPVLALFSALGLIAALGYELRVPPAALRTSTSLLVLAGALVSGGLGYLVLGDQGGGLWVAAVAVVHGLLGVGVLALRTTSREIGFVLLGVSLISADVAFALLVSGPALAVGWAASAAALALLARWAGESELVRLTLGGQLALATGHALLFDAPPGSAEGGEDVAAAVSALAAVAVSAFACARAAARESAGWRYALDTLSLLALAYVTGLVLDGVPLVLAWAAEAVALARIAERTYDRVAALGSLGFLGLAAGHVLVVEAPPSALVYGVDGLLGVALALGALAVAFVRCARVPLPWDVRGAGHVVAGAAILYLSSVAIVGFFQPGVEAVGGGLGLDVRQQGQAILSAFWSLGGVVALWVGLRRGHRTVRLAGLGLLALAVAKVFLYDLAMLESAYRVLSFVVLGVLLLLAAFVFQRIPRAATRPPQPRPGAWHQDTSDVDLSGV